MDHLPHTVLLLGSCLPLFTSVLSIRNPQVLPRRRRGKEYATIYYVTGFENVHDDPVTDRRKLGHTAGERKLKDKKKPELADQRGDHEQAQLGVANKANVQGGIDRGTVDDGNEGEVGLFTFLRNG